MPAPDPTPEHVADVIHQARQRIDAECAVYEALGVTHSNVGVEYAMSIIRARGFESIIQNATNKEYLRAIHAGTHAVCDELASTYKAKKERN